jgi:hypothetical protein
MKTETPSAHHLTVVGRINMGATTGQSRITATKKVKFYFQKGPVEGLFYLGVLLMRAILTVLLAIVPSVVYSWDGQRTDTGGQIEVESYNHGGTGEGEVEFYDYESGEYRQGYLDMHPGGTGEIQDYETGETYEVEME